MRLSTDRSAGQSRCDRTVCGAGSLRMFDNAASQTSNRSIHGYRTPGEHPESDAVTSSSSQLAARIVFRGKLTETEPPINFIRTATRERPSRRSICANSPENGPDTISTDAPARNGPTSAVPWRRPAITESGTGIGRSPAATIARTPRVPLIDRQRASARSMLTKR